MGEKLLTDQDKIPSDIREHDGLIVGPMFNHLLANLVLREIDITWSKEMPACYFRYVDDLTLVGTSEEVEESFSFLRSKLDELGLELHSEASSKFLAVPVDEWIKGKLDFNPILREVSWPSFICDLKTYLLCHPENCEELKQIFKDEGFRVPIPNYSIAVNETDYLEGLIGRTSQAWFRFRNRSISIDALLKQARFVRDTYQVEFEQLFATLNHADAFGRKRLIPKLRYRASRLIYLSSDDKLREVAKEAKFIPELGLHSVVMSAVSSGDIDILLGFGVNAAQAAAQPLKTVNRDVTAGKVWIDQKIQGLAVFFLNGVDVKLGIESLEKSSELIKLAKQGPDLSLMKSDNKFIQELACLHGLSDAPRHSDILSVPFDTDEELAMDAINLLEASMSS